MCDAATAVIMASSVIQAAGQRQQYQAQAAASRFNASELEAQASQAARVSAFQSAELVRDTRRNISEGQVQLAGANVALGSGSAAMWREQNFTQLDRDLEMQEENTLMEIGSLRRQARQARRASSQMQQTGNLAAIGSLLQGAGSVMGR